ncbi:hypothetical protein [Synechococcus sp. PCC 7336]|uniref:hypothetical protein n=1 Tax=Synechococcus sp. PCC 7336 TaxID=195250 RepID=UPI00034BAB41|nr:hypothetical protein [Synechococcus sp. PCC 7336]
MWGRPSRLDRIEQTVERLAEISEATNLRIDRFVDASEQQIQILHQRTEQLQRAVEYLMSKDG